VAVGVEFDAKNCFPTTGRYDIPVLKKQDTGDLSLLRWIPYTSVTGYKGDRTRTGVHFFIYDQGFENIWHDPYRLDRLVGFSVVTTPDFSTYTDMPLAFQIWNRFRSQYIGCFMQEIYDLTVIPTLCWSTPKSFEFTFDGIPEDSVCITNSLGIMLNDHVVCDYHRLGLKEAIKRVHPEKILVYGGARKFYPKYSYLNIDPFWKEMAGRRIVRDERISKRFPKDKTVFELQ
jgi:hypothetical protein